MIRQQRAAYLRRVGRAFFSCGCPAGGFTLIIINPPEHGFYVFNS